MPLTIDKEELLGFYNHIKLKADTYFDNKVKPDWEKATRLYRDQFDFGSYKPDPENVSLPLADNLVTRLASVFSRALINLDGEYFTVESVPKEQEFAAKGSEAIVDYVFEDNKFPAKFNKNLQAGFITSIVPFKVFYETEVVKIFDEDTQGNIVEREEVIGKVKIKRISPWNIRLDPTEDSDNYIMEIVKVPLHSFRDLAKNNKWNMVEVEKAIEALQATHKDTDPETGAVNNEAFNPIIELRIVNARVAYNKEGDEIARDIEFIVANHNNVVNAEKNTLPGGRFPIEVGRPLVGAEGKYGRGYLTKLCSLVSAYIETVDLLMTAFRLSVWGMWGYDPSQIVNKGQHEFTAVVRPGGFYPYKGELKNIYNNTAGMQLGLQIQNLMDFILQIVSYQNEFTQGRSTSKRTTAFEIRAKSAESQSFFNDIAIELEDQIITPLIELVLLTVFNKWNTSGSIPKENMITNPDHLGALNSLSNVERLKLVLNGQIRARGMSGRIRRAAMFDKLALLFEIGAQYPPLLEQIPPDKIAKSFFESVGEAPSDWLQQVEAGATGPGPGAANGAGIEQVIEEVVNQQGGEVNA